MTHEGYIPCHDYPRGTIFFACLCAAFAAETGGLLAAVPHVAKGDGSGHATEILARGTRLCVYVCWSY